VVQGQIEIRVLVGARQLDLRVPAGVTARHLKVLLAEVFHDYHVKLPADWQLRPQSKEIGLGKMDLFKDFSISSGDIFKVGMGEGFESI